MLSRSILKMIRKGKENVRFRIFSVPLYVYRSVAFFPPCTGRGHLSHLLMIRYVIKPIAKGRFSRLNIYFNKHVYIYLKVKIESKNNDVGANTSLYQDLVVHWWQETSWANVAWALKGSVSDILYIIKTTFKATQFQFLKFENYLQCARTSRSSAY